jgi:hypothetical protein
MRGDGKAIARRMLDREYKKERDVKERMKEIFKKMRAWWFMYVPVGYGKSGVPDFIACVPVVITEDMVGQTYGIFFAPEAKFGKEQPTDMQNIQMGQIRDAGGITFVVNEQNVEDMQWHFQNARRPQ